MDSNAIGNIITEKLKGDAFSVPLLPVKALVILAVVLFILLLFFKYQGLTKFLKI